MSKKLTTFALVGIAAILAATGCEKSTPPVTQMTGKSSSQPKG